MLVLSRKPDERIRIGDNIIITLVEIRSDKVRIGIEAPPDMPVHREEIYQQMLAHGDVHSLAEDQPTAIQTKATPEDQP